MTYIFFIFLVLSLFGCNTPPTSEKKPKNQPTYLKYCEYTTKDNKKTVVRSTNQSKKEVFGAFKALTSFYHINLGYTLLKLKPTRAFYISRL